VHVVLIKTVETSDATVNRGHVHGHDTRGAELETNLADFSCSARACRAYADKLSTCYGSRGS
jgi:hypothetical protein